MNTLIGVILTVYLIYSSYTDIKKYTISTLASLLSCILILLVQIGDNARGSDIFLSLIPGLFLLLTARLTRQSVGYGDGIVFLVIGIGIGFNRTLLLLFLAFSLSAIFSLYLIMRRKPGKYALPFVPFIMCSYILIFF